LDDPIDVVALTRSLSQRPRGRACILFTQDYTGQKAWAAELARQSGADHLHLLDLFANEANLAENLSAFSVSDLFRLLAERGQNPILVVSGLEFLKAAWTSQSSVQETFARQVEMWDRKPALLFVMQHDRILAAYKFDRFKQHRFTVDQRDTLALM